MNIIVEAYRRHAAWLQQNGYRADAEMYLRWARIVEQQERNASR